MQELGRGRLWWPVCSTSSSTAREIEWPGISGSWTVRCSSSNAYLSVSLCYSLQLKLPSQMQGRVCWLLNHMLHALYASVVRTACVCTDLGDYRRGHSVVPTPDQFLVLVHLLLAIPQPTLLVRRR